MPKPAENNAENNAEGGVTGKGFKPGQSGNPGGRPKGLARKVRETIGPDGDALVGFWTAVLTGYVPYEERQTDGSLKRSYERVEVSDRIAVSKVLAERGWGKPAQFVPIEDGDPLELSDAGADAMAASLDARMDDLEARRQAKKKSATG